MRTTLNIDEDVLSLAKNLAESRSISIGQAISELARQGYKAQFQREHADGFIVFDVPADAPTINPEDARLAEVAEEVEKYGKELK